MVWQKRLVPVAHEQLHRYGRLIRFSVFGLATMAIDGLTTGFAAPALFVAIITSDLAFNTSDFMLGAFTGQT